jgi:hypothetical protein
VTNHARPAKHQHFSGKPDKPMEVISALTKTEREDAEAKALNKPFVLGLLFGSVLLFGLLLLILWALPSFGAEAFPPFAKHILLFAIAAIFWRPLFCAEQSLLGSLPANGCHSCTACGE